MFSSSEKTRLIYFQYLHYWFIERFLDFFVLDTFLADATKVLGFIGALRILIFALSLTSVSLSVWESVSLSTIINNKNKIIFIIFK